MPLVDCEPLHAPEAAQEVALVDDHVSVELFPRTTEVGLTEIVTVGGGVVTVRLADALALPPAPVQVRV